MFSLKNINIATSNIFKAKRFINTLPKDLEIQVDNSIEKGNYKQYKNHPGRNILKYIQIPLDIEQRINKVISNVNITDLKIQADKLKRYLHDRRCPLEKTEKKSLKEKIAQEYLPQDAEINSNEFDFEANEQRIESILKSKVNPWLKIEYDTRLGCLYLASRFASDYSILFQIYSEIKRKDEKFVPNHLFDFGSGVGTSMWASKSVWQNESAEFFNIDTSSYMNSLADLITRNGSLSNTSCFKNAIFKRNFPKSGQQEFDLVTCAFTLFELANRINRLECLALLWQKVKIDGYLVLVEIGTKHGFKLINEARDFILNDLIKNEETENKFLGQIFAPCPHHFECPLVKENQICRFFVSYRPLDIYDHKIENNISKEEYPYSYLVIKKSPKINTSNNWPRLVYKNPITASGGTTHTWLCTPQGTVDHLICSKNRCKITRSLSKYSKMGDELPIFLKNK